MTAMFKHKKTDGLYTVAAQARVEAGEELTDMQAVFVFQRGADGYVVTTKNPGLQRHSPLYQPRVQANMPVKAFERCVLYRGTNGDYWLRPLSEFTDGRFEPMNPQAACMMPPQWHFGAQMGGAPA
jgi:hypothetical protein